MNFDYLLDELPAEYKFQRAFVVKFLVASYREVMN